MKRGRRGLAISGMCLLLIVSVFSGCSKKIEGKWKKDPADVKGVERISDIWYGDGNVTERGELYDKMEPIFSGRLMSIRLEKYSNREKTLYVAITTDEKCMHLGIYRMCKNKEPITEDIKASFRDYMKYIKKFHKELLKEFDPKEYVQIQIALRDEERAASFTFNATENGEYSWEPIKMGGMAFAKEIPYEEVPKDWLEVLDEDKFFTQNYARGEEPEYVE